MLKFNQIKKLIENGNGGATLDENGKIKNFKKGYQVSFKDCYTLKFENQNEVVNAVNKVLNACKNKNIDIEDRKIYCGLWLENGFLYVDMSTKINNKQEALYFGSIKNQISIFDWKNKNCIYLKNN